MESQLESSKRVNQEKLQSISEELKKTEDKYSLKIVESVSEENDVFGKVIDLEGNIGKPYIEGKFTPEWKGANKDIQWSSEYRYNSTKKFKYPTLSDKSALNIAKKLKEIEEREEKKKELIEQCAFDTWIEEKYMNIVY